MLVIFFSNRLIPIILDGIIITNATIIRILRNFGFSVNM